MAAITMSSTSRMMEFSSAGDIFCLDATVRHFLTASLIELLRAMPGTNFRTLDLW